MCRKSKQELKNIMSLTKMAEHYLVYSVRLLYSRDEKCITKTSLYNLDPLKPHFCIVKLGLFFLFLFKIYIVEAVLTSTDNLYFEQKYEKISFFYLKFSVYLNRRVFIMVRRK